MRLVHGWLLAVAGVLATSAAAFAALGRRGGSQTPGPSPPPAPAVRESRRRRPPPPLAPAPPARSPELAQRPPAAEKAAGAAGSLPIAPTPPGSRSPESSSPSASDWRQAAIASAVALHGPGHTPGQVPESLESSGALANAFVIAQARAHPNATRAFVGTGVADRQLGGLQLSTGGAVVVLYTPQDPMVWRLLRSLCHRFLVPHPLLLFWTDAPPRPELRDALSYVLGARGCVQRQLWFVELPQYFWAEEGLQDAVAEGDVSARGGYRRMCWFWLRTVHWLPVLRPLPFILRLDTDSEVLDTPVEDPISAVARSNGSYGYVSFCFDNPDFTKGLWRHTASYVDGTGAGRWPSFHVASPQECARQPDSLRLSRRLVKQILDSCPVPMFYTNFEVLRLGFFRRPEVDEWLRGLRDGVVAHRWGDAPLRALTIGLFASPSEVVHFNDFNYRHGRKGGKQIVDRGNNLTVHWSYGGRASSSIDVFYLGICTVAAGKR
eukprot:TRINITY_DN40702_c0_g1_i1.p1 TRINITY_DN40702_c0_g1~~TRINITY_DN40702_c0_g1_i1.p1  ORF type:complete len:493 (+),score=49.75 TRINITY_DN40702_c0_g1_i1:84-1562(+)